MTFDTVHIVRRNGARRFFSTDQLNPHLEKRLFYGLPPYSTVRCGAFSLLMILRRGAVRCRVFFFVFFRCGAVRIFFFQNPTVRCGAVLIEAKSYGAVWCGLTAPHRKKKPHRKKPWKIDGPGRVEAHHREI